MEPAWIESLVKSVSNVCEMMLGMSVDAKGDPKPLHHGGDTPMHEISALISFSGAIEGSVTLCLASNVAGDLVNRMMGSPIDQSSEEFADAVGEIANMVAGGAKSNINEPGVSISVPTVVTGKGHLVHTPKDLPATEVGFDSEAGEFVAHLALRKAA